MGLTYLPRRVIMSTSKGDIQQKEKEIKTMAMTREEILTKIKDEGAGAGNKWTHIAAAAMAGDATCKALCAQLIGEPISNLGQLWLITLAASDTMENGELGEMANEARTELNAGKIAKADEYVQNKLASIRKERGLTQKELAAKAGIPLLMCQRYENGAKSFLKANAIYTVRIARALGVSVEDLVGDVI